MYRQARFYIRTALIYLLVAFTVGAALLLNQGLALDGRIGAFTPVFYHLLMVGWATQLIGGVALWMFPPYTRAQPRGNETLGWLAYVALNVGLICRVLGEPLLAWGVPTWPTLLLAASAVLQVAAVWLLVLQLWPRVKGRITPLPDGKPAGAWGKEKR
jgi:hypothetical protein